MVTTLHGDTVATTAVHRHDFERHIGGVRFVPRPTGPQAPDGLSEVGHLASAMTQKCMAAMIPADGQKSVIMTTPDVLASEDLRVQILVDHARAVAELDPGVIFGPDMNCGEPIQDRAARVAGMLDHFTGLSPAARGLSIDMRGYTASGLFEAIRVALGSAGLRGQRVSIQGFGAVGAHTAWMLHQAGAEIVAVSYKELSLVASRHTLNIPAIFDYWTRFGDAGLERYAAGVTTADFRKETPEALFSVPVSIFVPAARTAIMAMSQEIGDVQYRENPDVRDVDSLHRRHQRQADRRGRQPSVVGERRTLARR